jgi:hypothetical protein
MRPIIMVVSLAALSLTALNAQQATVLHNATLRSSYDINFQNLLRLQRFFMASMRRPRLVGLLQAWAGQLWSVTH